MRLMRILLTNDDGVHAPGMLALKRSLEGLGELFVVAPERPRSAAGHAVTLHKPLRLAETTLADGSRAWCSSGTPSDCVSLGFEVVMDGRADLLVSGINDGANLGWDLTYSGTVMAAMEGAILGLTAIAVSVSGPAPRRYDGAGPVAARVVRAVMRRGLPANVLLNVNVPSLDPSQLGEIVITRQGRREYIDRIVRRHDPAGREYYWLSGSVEDGVQPIDTDVGAVEAGMISVTPLQLDMTAHPVREDLAAWPDWMRKGEEP
jgi:5'-nucleotidase